MKLKRFNDYFNEIKDTWSNEEYTLQDMKNVVNEIAIDDIITRQEEILERLDKLEKQEYEATELVNVSGRNDVVQIGTKHYPVRKKQ